MTLGYNRPLYLLPFDHRLAATRRPIDIARRFHRTSSVRKSSTVALVVSHRHRVEP
ncbi:MAG TPA: hypothetical protein VM737_12435 [Gemmatimonadota bacterium]|nr:hypothetical protein [Gemmatimonadota bacterium]